MAFDIRATVSGTAETRERAHEVAVLIREVLADNGFSGVIEVREIGTHDAFIRDVVRPGDKKAER